MQPYMNYSVPMNNGYNSQIPMQNPYQQRMDFLQSYQQSLQPAQMPVSNQQAQPIQNGLNGRIVQSADMITVNDVPMDCTAAVFPKQDMSEIYVKYWDNNGIIRTIVFKPVLENNTNNLPNTDEKTILSLSESVTGAFMERFDNLEKQINELMSKPMTKQTTSRTKKESETE